MLEREVTREIVSSLAVSHPADPPFPGLANARRRQCAGVLEWLDDSGLALQFWSRMLKSRVADQIPLEIAEPLGRNLADHKRRVHAMIGEFTLINACFASAGIPYAVLKGFSLVPNYAQNVFLRTSYDYDYVVAEDARESANEALQVAGYVRKECRVKHPWVYFDPARPPRSPSSRDELYQPEFPRTIELHWNLWHPDELRIPLSLPADFLPRRELRWLPVRGEFPDIAPVQYYALRDTDELLFQVLHTFRHILHNWCRLSSLLDLACFLETKSSDDAFWMRFFDRIVNVRHPSEMVGLVFSLASEIFGAMIPTAISERVMPLLRPPLRLWVTRYGHEAALSNFSGNKFALFLHREFIEHAKDWREVRRTRLFPLHRPNHAVRSASSARSDRLRGTLKQGSYVVQRLRHHAWSSVRYCLEVPLWTRACTKLVRLQR